MRYHLLLDADDTLWENNIYFEQAIHAFISFLDHSQLNAAEVRAENERASAEGLLLMAVSFVLCRLLRLEGMLRPGGAYQPAVRLGQQVVFCRHGFAAPQAKTYELMLAFRRTSMPNGSPITRR